MTFTSLHQGQSRPTQAAEAWPLVGSGAGQKGGEKCGCGRWLMRDFIEYICVLKGNKSKYSPWVIFCDNSLMSSHPQVSVSDSLFSFSFCSSQHLGLLVSDGIKYSFSKLASLML